MPGIQEAEKRLTDLEKVVLVMANRLETSEKILEEIRKVLVEQNKTQTDMIRVQNKQIILENSIVDLRKDFDERKVYTDPVIEDGKTFMNKAKGGLYVFLICFGVIQGIVAYEISQTFTRIAGIENRVDYYYEKLDDRIQKITKK